MGHSDNKKAQPNKPATELTDEQVKGAAGGSVIDSDQYFEQNLEGIDGEPTGYEIDLAGGEKFIIPGRP